MSIALVASTTATLGGFSPLFVPGLSPGIDTRGATLLVVSGANYPAGPVTVSDSLSNIWTRLELELTASTSQQLFYCSNPTVGPGHTFTIAGNYCAAVMYAFSGASGAPAAQAPGGKNTGLDHLQPGSLTPIADGSLLVTALNAYLFETSLSIDSGFTATVVPAINGSNPCAGAAYLIQPTAGAADPTWTCTSGAQAFLAATMAVWGPGANSRSADASFTNGGVTHSNSSITITLTGDAKWAGPGTFTLGVPTGYSVSGTITLGTGAGASSSALITTPVGATPGTIPVSISCTGTITYDAHFTLITPTAQIAPTDPLGGYSYSTLPSGNIVCLFFSDTTGSHNPTAVTGFNFAGATIVKNGTTFYLDTVQAFYSGYGNFLWFWLGTPQSIQILGNQDAGCVFSGAGATRHTTDVQTLAYQTYVVNAGAVNGTGVTCLTDYSSDLTATWTYSFTVLAGETYRISRNSPDCYSGGAWTVGGAATPHANYAVFDGATTHNYPVDQRAVGTYSRADLLFGWTDLGAASATATVVGGIVTGLTIVDGGSGYTTAPMVHIQGGYGRGATATATITSGVVTALTLTAGGSGFYLSPDVTTDAPPGVWIEPPTVTPAGTTLTVTVSNLAGSGTLYTNGIRLELVPKPFMAPGDTVVLNLPDSAVTTAAGTIAAQTLTLPLRTDGVNYVYDANDWLPFDPSLPRHMGIGYNSGVVDEFETNSVFADRLKKQGGWQGIPGFTVDSDGQLTSIMAGQTVQMQFLSSTENSTAGGANGCGDGNRAWGFPVDPPIGKWSLLYRTPGNPLLKLVQASSIPVTIPTGTTTTQGLDTLIQWEPASVPYPMYSPQLSLQCISQGSTNDYITHARLFAPGTPPTWPHLADPALFYRLTQVAAGGGFFRDMQLSGCIGDNIVEFADYPAPTNMCYGRVPHVLDPVISRIIPITDPTQTDALALAKAVFSPVQSVSVFEFTAPHGMVDRQGINLRGWTPLGAHAAATCTVSGGAVGGTFNITNGGSGYSTAPFLYFTTDPSDTTGHGAKATCTLTAGVITSIALTNAGAGYTAPPTLGFFAGFPDTGTDTTPSITQFYDGTPVFVVDATRIITIGTTFSSTSGSATPMTIAGIASVSGSGAYQLNGAEVLHVDIGSNAVPPQDLISLCNETGVNWHHNLPPTASDGHCITLGKYAAAHLNVGLIFRNACGNEYWNTFSTSFGIALYSSRLKNSQWLASSGADGVSLSNYDAWNAYDSSRKQALIMSGWAGIPYIQIQGYGSGATAYATIPQSGVGAHTITSIALTGPVTALAVTLGGSYTSAPTVALSAPEDPRGKRALATAVMTGTAVTGLTLVSGGLGYASAPAVLFSGGGGSGAAATATINLGGWVYDSTTAVSVNRVDGFGSGAAVTATTSGGRVTALNLISGGSGYTAAPTLLITCGYATGAIAHCTLGSGGTAGQVVSVTLDYGGSYQSAPVISILGGYGTGATATATVSGGKVTAITPTAAGSGYTYTSRAISDFVRAYEGSQGGSNIAKNIAFALNTFGEPIDTLLVANYQDNDPGIGNYGPIATSIVDAAYDAMSDDDAEDLFGLHALRVDYSGYYGPGQFAALVAGGIGYPVKLGAYEGGTVNGFPYGTNPQRKILRSSLLPRSPRFFRLTLALLQQWEHTYLFTDVCREAMDSFIAPTVSTGNMWFTFLVTMSDVGTGAAYENADRFYVPNLLSQEGGAHRFYATPATNACTVSIAATAQASTASVAITNTPPATNTVALAAAGQPAAAALSITNTPPATTVALAAAGRPATSALVAGEIPPANLIAIAAAAGPSTLALAIQAGQIRDLKQAIVAALGAETRLTALIGPNLYPVALPQTASLTNSAALVYRFTDSLHSTNLMTAAGMQSVGVQFEVRSYRHRDLETIIELLRNLFQGFSASLAGLPIAWVSLETEVDDYDDPLPGSDLGTHWKEIDFLFKLRESIPTNT